MIPFILLLSEVILRISGKAPAKGIHSALNPVFDNIPGVYEPGQNFIDQSKPELPHHVSINSLGYRGPEVERKKYPGRVRILCLGDSFTFGNYVLDHENIPKGEYSRSLPETIIDNYLQKNNIDYIDLYDLFLKHSSPLQAYGKIDQHFSPTGHKWVSDEIIHYLTKMRDIN